MDTVAKFYNRRKILITGGAGFIGSHLAEKLVNLGAHVTILDNFSSGNVENLRRILHKIELIVGDIREPKVCQSATTGKSTIFHMAAMVSVPKTITNPTLCHDINITGTKVLLESAISSKSPHVIFSSSSAVYGEFQGICSETTPTHPKSPYAHSKLEGEQLCINYAKKTKTCCSILRYFNVYGPNQKTHGQNAAVIAKFTDSLKNGQKLTIFGDGSQIRDYIHVSKVVEANLTSGAINTISCNIFNIATGKSITLLQLVEQLEQETGRKNSGIVFKPSRSGDILYSQADCRKFKQLMRSTS